MCFEHLFYFINFVQYIWFNWRIKKDNCRSEFQLRNIEDPIIPDFLITSQSLNSTLDKIILISLYVFIEVFAQCWFKINFNIIINFQAAASSWFKIITRMIRTCALEWELGKCDCSFFNYTIILRRMFFFG